MSAAKHTPGPWAARYTDDNGQAIVRGEYLEVATCWHHGVRALELGMQANARLIAAAPELLEALKALAAVAEMTTFSDQYPAECEVARAAIAKATGEA